MGQKVNRRFFLKSIAAMGTLFFMGLWYKMVGDQSKNKQLNTFEILLKGLAPVTFYDQFIVIKEKDTWLVLSSKCTHLGCRIQRLEQGKLQCPCHGSAFQLNGDVVAGPAFKALPQLPFEIDEERQILTVFLT